VSAPPVAVFARAPEAGEVKTRLAPALGPEGAASLYRAFVEDTLHVCRRAEALDVELWVAGDAAHPFWSRVGAGLPRSEQPDDLDLGGRMAAALHALIAHAGRGLVIGTDTPTLPAHHIGAAARALEAADVVLGPSADGGFYLVGARGVVPPIFESVRYSTPFAFSDTVRAARRAGLGVATTAPWYDVDTPSDLAILRAHLAVDPGAAPATAAALGGRDR